VPRNSKTHWKRRSKKRAGAAEKPLRVTVEQYSRRTAPPKPFKARQGGKTDAN